jgi:hypothetical protein
VCYISGAHICGACCSRKGTCVDDNGGVESFGGIHLFGERSARSPIASISASGAACVFVPWVRKDPADWGAAPRTR